MKRILAIVTRHALEVLMPRPHHSTSFRAIALLSMVTMLLSGCTSWQPISLEPGAVPNKVRITTESERFVFKNARLVGDTAIGRADLEPTVNDPHRVGCNAQG